MGDTEVGSLLESESEPDHRVKVTTFSQKREGVEKELDKCKLLLLFIPLFFGGGASQVALVVRTCLPMQEM